MERKKCRHSTIMAVLASVGVNLVLIVWLASLIKLEPQCAYESLVRKVENPSYVQANLDYRYALEEVTFVGDAFDLIRISGWEVSRKGDLFVQDTKALILQSDEHTYTVQCYEKERIDLYYLDPYKTKSKAGFFTYIPSDVVEKGTYNLGILLENEEQVIWTKEIINIE